MSPKVQLACIALSMFVIVSAIAPSVSALTLQVESDGSIRFLSDARVLGESSENPLVEKKLAPLPYVIQVRAEDEFGTSYEVRKKSLLPDEPVTWQAVESGKENDFSVRFEDKQSEVRTQRIQNVRELEQLKMDTQGMQVDARAKLLEQKEASLNLELQKKEQEVIREEGVSDQSIRQELEISDRFRERGRELEIGTTDGPKARLRGAEFLLDTETGKVTVITPSGTEHVLSHMPDDVVTRLQEHGNMGFSAENMEIDIEVQDTDRVIHRVRGVSQMKKVFGVIPRQVRGDAVVDDETGTVEFVYENTFINRVLRLFE